MNEDDDGSVFVVEDKEEEGEDDKEDEYGYLKKKNQKKIAVNKKKKSVPIIHNPSASSTTGVTNHCSRVSHHSSQDPDTLTITPHSIRHPQQPLTYTQLPAVRSCRCYQKERKAHASM